MYEISTNNNNYLKLEKSVNNFFTESLCIISHAKTIKNNNVRQRETIKNNVRQRETITNDNVRLGETTMQYKVRYCN